MKTIYRFDLKNEINDIELPVGSQVLSVGITKDSHPVYRQDIMDFQDVEVETISMWVLCDPDDSKETRRFLIFGTGADMETNLSNFTLTFIGTVQKKNTYAFHIFEVVNQNF